MDMLIANFFLKIDSQGASVELKKRVQRQSPRLRVRLPGESRWQGMSFVG